MKGLTSDSEHANRDHAIRVHLRRSEEVLLEEKERNRNGVIFFKWRQKLYPNLFIKKKRMLS
jgi:hypothetical protein